MALLEKIAIVFLYAYLSYVLIGGFYEMFAYTRDSDRRIKVKTF